MRSSAPPGGACNGSHLPQRWPRLAVLDDTDARALLDQVQPRTFRRGHSVLHEGASAACLSRCPARVRRRARALSTRSAASPVGWSSASRPKASSWCGPRSCPPAPTPTSTSARSTGVSRCGTVTASSTSEDRNAPGQVATCSSVSRRWRRGCRRGCGRTGRPRRTCRPPTRPAWAERAAGRRCPTRYRPCRGSPRHSLSCRAAPGASTATHRAREVATGGDGTRDRQVRSRSETPSGLSPAGRTVRPLP